MFHPAGLHQGPVTQDLTSGSEISHFESFYPSSQLYQSEISSQYNLERPAGSQIPVGHSVERPPYPSYADSASSVAPSTSSSIATSTSSVPAPSSTEKAKATVKEFGINLEKPKHSEFAVLANRINSYTNHWPENIRQRPKELALCGFFYGGSGDTVFCFFCGQGLHSWEDTDNPWEEHAKWSPNCVFLRNVKGQEFIDLIKVKDTDPEKYLQWKREEEEKHSKKKPSRTERDCRPKVSKGFSEDLLNLPPAASIIEVFGKEKAVDAIKVFIHQTGKTNFKSDDLASIVFDLEDNKVQVPQQKEAIDVMDGAPQGQKVEIDEELHHLMDENLSLKKQTTCLVCRTELVSVVFLPCGHICCCADCSPAMKDCPLCKAFVKGTVRTFLT